jgi:hypothetical protein
MYYISIILLNLVIGFLVVVFDNEVTIFDGAVFFGVASMIFGFIYLLQKLFNKFNK